jgi:hypothetical protein
MEMIQERTVADLSVAKARERWVGATPKLAKTGRIRFVSLWNGYSTQSMNLEMMFNASKSTMDPIVRPEPMKTETH